TAGPSDKRRPLGIVMSTDEPCAPLGLSRESRLWSAVLSPPSCGPAAALPPVPPSNKGRQTQKPIAAKTSRITHQYFLKGSVPRAILKAGDAVPTIVVISLS